MITKYAPENPKRERSSRGRTSIIFTARSFARVQRSLQLIISISSNTVDEYAPRKLISHPKFKILKLRCCQAQNAKSRHNEATVQTKINGFAHESSNTDIPDSFWGWTPLQSMCTVRTADQMLFVNFACTSIGSV